MTLAAAIPPNSEYSNMYSTCTCTCVLHCTSDSHLHKQEYTIARKEEVEST